MSNEKWYYKFRTHGFLLLFYEIKGGCSDASWILCSMLFKLLLINITMVEPLNSGLLHNNTDAANLATPSGINGTNVNTFFTAKTTVRQRSAFSELELEKEVVDRLIKQWAPVVWLAPEEKFMPLGVEEFLSHVHPESKDYFFTPGMSFGENSENSEKSFLVTNTEIDQLLDNDTSFIHGRNPNMSPVPIYAVVTLCNLYQNEGEKQHTEAKSPNLKYMEDTYSPQSQKPLTKVFLPTRGPYIPITLGPQSQVDSKLRRSSRLYPLLKRTKRSLSIFPNISSDPRYNLVTAQSVQSVSKLQNSEPIELDSEKESENDNVNNFIANLVDNVKFSVHFNEKDEVFENENEYPLYGLTNTEGTAMPSFHVSYWMFYPYSQGKNMCTLSLGPFGRIPFPAVYGYCLGRKKDIGSHIGDWEHMTLYFTGLAEPESMYVSAHDAGAYYAYNRLTGSFEFKRQDTRKGILQRPNFPKTVTTFNDHPVLFAAKGSHGLWTAPGKHRFVKVARLYDINGFGTPWNTWKNVQITYENLKSYGRAFAPSWLSFKGKWGNPKSKCHPLRRIGLNFCEFTDGPTGIPLKEPHFQCFNSFRR